jgi:hypothetical protein
MADGRRCLKADRFSLDEDRRSPSAVLLSLEEDRCRRSTVRVRRTAVHFVVDADRSLGSPAVAPVPEPRFVGETSLGIVSFTHLIVNGAVS